MTLSATPPVSACPPGVPLAPFLEPKIETKGMGSLTPQTVVTAIFVAVYVIAVPVTPNRDHVGQDLVDGPGRPDGCGIRSGCRRSRSVARAGVIVLARDRSAPLRDYLVSRVHGDSDKFHAAVRTADGADPVTSSNALGWSDPAREYPRCRAIPHVDRTHTALRLLQSVHPVSRCQNRRCLASIPNAGGDWLELFRIAMTRFRRTINQTA